MEIQELLDELAIPYQIGGEHRHVRHGWIGIDCPWCGSEGKWHLGIPLAGNAVAVCWVCGPHSIAEALHSVAKLPWTDCNRYASALTRKRTRLIGRVTGERPRPTTTTVPTGIGPLAPAHRRYLRSRGFDPAELSALWGLRSTGILGRLSWRIWIPVYQDGVLVTWSSRALGDVGGRYLHARPDQELVAIKETLYGEDHCCQSVIVCEGPADVWRVGYGAVALWGIGWTEAQARRLERFPRRCICFDTSRPARRRAWALAERLHGSLGETFVVELDAADPGSASAAEIRRLRRQVFMQG